MSRLKITDGERRALEELVQFPLLQAIAGRRSRRFPTGASIPDGPLAYTSTEPPEPLSELERALILSTMTGVTGWHFGITRHPGYAPKFPNYPGSATGRTIPSAAGFHTSQLFFTDDSGMYFLPTRDAIPVAANPDGRIDLDAWLQSTVDSYQQLSAHRLELPREEPYMEGHNLWVANHPGSLLAFPVADLAEHLIANLAFFAANGYLIYDDINNRPIPELKKFNGLAHIEEPFPLSFVEQYTLTEATAELTTATYNGVLLLQAIGLGGWMFDGLDRLSVLGASGDPRAPGFGFRYDTDPRWPFPNATGLPGVFETLSPPHVPDIAAAVDKYVQRKWGPGGPLHPDTPGPWRDSGAVRRSALPADGISEVVAAEAAYIYETFGKLPGTVPTVHVLMYLQAQSLDLGFYDTHFAPGAYLSTHAQHASRWYGPGVARVPGPEAFNSWK